MWVAPVADAATLDSSGGAVGSLSGSILTETPLRPRCCQAYARCLIGMCGHSARSTRTMGACTHRVFPEEVRPAHKPFQRKEAQRGEVVVERVAAEHAPNLPSSWGLGDSRLASSTSAAAQHVECAAPASLCPEVTHACADPPCLGASPAAASARLGPRPAPAPPRSYATTRSAQKQRRTQGPDRRAPCTEGRPGNAKQSTRGNMGPGPDFPRCVGAPVAANPLAAVLTAGWP